MKKIYAVFNIMLIVGIVYVFNFHDAEARTFGRNDFHIVVNEKNIRIGDSTEKVLENFSYPTEVVPRFKGEWYIYNTDYTDLIFIGITDGTVSAVATNSNNFVLDGRIKSGYAIKENMPARYNNILIKDGDLVEGFFIETIEEVFNSIPATTAVKENFYFTNVFRVKNGYPPFLYDEALCNISLVHAQDMAGNNFFSHTSPTLGDFKDRMDRSNYGYKKAAENLASGYMNGIRMHEGFINSEIHRNGILSDCVNMGLGFSKSGENNYLVQTFSLPELSSVLY